MDDCSDLKESSRNIDSSGFSKESTVAQYPQSRMPSKQAFNEESSKRLLDRQNDDLSSSTGGEETTQLTKSVGTCHPEFRPMQKRTLGPDRLPFQTDLGSSETSSQESTAVNVPLSREGISPPSLASEYASSGSGSGSGSTYTHPTVGSSGGTFRDTPSENGHSPKAKSRSSGGSSDMTPQEQAEAKDNFPTPSGTHKEKSRASSDSGKDSGKEKSGASSESGKEKSGASSESGKGKSATSGSTGPFSDQSSNLSFEERLMRMKMTKGRTPDSDRGETTKKSETSGSRGKTEK